MEDSMLKGLFGPTTVTHMLRGGLEETSATHRAIAARVSSVLSSSGNVEFADELARKTAEGRLNEADLQRDMAALADTQIRYEADAKLLQEAYGRLRSAMRDRG
jgi:flagellar basal body rod protein FlgB